jgi:hypothetical protein
MGRSSVEATNACLILAVRAVRAALSGRVLCLAVDVDGFPVVPVRFAEVDFDFVDGFFAVVDVPVLAGVPV